MIRIEARQDEMYLFGNDTSLPLSRASAVQETKTLIDIFTSADLSSRLAERIKKARTILIVGPGCYAPELDLFFRETTFGENGSVSFIISDDISKIILVEKTGMYSRPKNGIYDVIARAPNIEVHDLTTIFKYCQGTKMVFDLILYMRTQPLEIGQQPEYLARHLEQLLCKDGLALVTGDLKGIERLIKSSANALTVIVKLDDLPEGGFEGGFRRHSGVVLRSNSA